MSKATTPPCQSTLVAFGMPPLSVTGIRATLLASDDRLSHCRAVWVGGGGGYLELGSAPWVRVSRNKKKVLHDPNTYTTATICKEVVTPPQRGNPGTGGGGARIRIEKIIGGSFLVLKL